MANEMTGVDGLVAVFKQIPDDLRKKYLRNELAAGARIVRDDAAANAPVLQTVNVKNRKPGTVKNAIAVRTSKSARAAGDVGVFVNVKPAKGAKFKTVITRVLGVKVKGRTQVRASKRGADSPDDPFYWRFLQFGTKKMAAVPFLSGSAEKFGEALRRIEDGLRKRFAKYEQGNK